MFRRALIAPSSSITISGVKALKFNRSSSFSGLEPKRRMETAAPSSASGGMIALTREPSCRPGVDHRTRLVDTTADLGDDAIDDLHQVVVVAELDVGFLHLPVPLDIDVLGTVDQDVGDLAILQQHLQRAQAKRLVQHLVDQPFALAAIQQRVFGVAEMLDDQADFAPQRIALQLAHLVQIELVDKLAVNPSLQIFEFLVLGGIGQSLVLN